MPKGGAGKVRMGGKVPKKKTVQKPFPKEGQEQPTLALGKRG